MNKSLTAFILCIAVSSWAQTRQTSKKQKASLKGKTVGEMLRGISHDDLNKSSVALPETQRLQATRTIPRDLWAVKPPRSSDFYQGDSADEMALEKITDQQIGRLYRLTQQFRRSPNRGELWLRLAELYSEKARLIEFRKQHEYDQKIVLYGQKKLSIKPRLDLRAADDYTLKAVQLYEWFIKDFPKDEKIDQALFFLGYNNVQLARVKVGIDYYKDLTKRFPQSPYVSESQFALGEYYFENESWKEAYQRYMEVVKHKAARLHDFALYKAAWCLYRLNQSPLGLKYLEEVIRHGRAQTEEARLEGRKEVNRIRLASEARKDLVPFYAETGQYKEAEGYFLNITGSEPDTLRLLEGLAYNYAAAGRRDESAYLFHQLIVKNTNAPKAFDFQYQIVLDYLNVGQNKIFQHELYLWITIFGPTGDWWKANSGNKTLLNNSYALQEATLRNYVLQIHQTAQNTRNANSQREAFNGYILYLKSFPNGSQSLDMRFFFAELLFDMKRWNDAAVQYQWVAENGTKSKYREKATINAVLALEKNLPDEAKVRERLGDSVAKQPLDPPVARFEQAARRYITNYPKGEKALEIEFRLGRLYFTYNHFDEALQIFNHIVKNYPKSKYAQYSANLIMDTYDLKKDYGGLAKVGVDLLANPEIANSSAGNDIRTVVERASFKRGQDLELSKNYGDSARAYEAFAKNNPRSALATTAQYNAGINYERAGDTNSSIRMYAVVLNTKDPKSADFRNKVRKLYANAAFQTGKLREAAREFETYAAQNPKDAEVGNFYYNAAIIYDGFNMDDSAIRDYEKFFKAHQSSDYKQAYFYIAQMQQRQGHKRAAMENFQKYLDTHPSEVAKKIEATYQMGLLSEQIGQASKAKFWYNRTISEYKANQGEKNVKARFAAEARLKLALHFLDDLKDIRIPANPKQQQAAVQKKLALINKLNNEMADVIRFSYGPTIVGAFASIGQAYDHMAVSIAKVPPPSGLNAGELKQYQAGVEQIVAPMRAKAVENYKSALDRSSQLESYCEWTNIARVGLSRYSPKDASGQGERAIDSKTPDWMSL